MRAQCGRPAIVQAQDLLGLGSEARMKRAVHCGAELAVAGIAGSVHRRTAQKIHRMMVLYERVNYKYLERLYKAAVSGKLTVALSPIR